MARKTQSALLPKQPMQTYIGAFNLADRFDMPVLIAYTAHEVKEMLFWKVCWTLSDPIDAICMLWVDLAPECKALRRSVLDAAVVHSRQLAENSEALYAEGKCPHFFELWSNGGYELELFGDGWKCNEDE